MRIENGDYNISITFIGRAIDGLNVWDKLKNDTNSIEIFLGFSVEDGWGTTEGMCIPLKDIEMIYKGLSSVCESNSFTYSCNFPFNNSNEEFVTVMAEKTEKGVQILFRIYDNFCDYVELSEVMSETKFNNLLLELKDVLDKYPII